MKQLYASALRIFLLLLITATFNLTYSQVQNTWKGGTPGMEQEWDCHKNWSSFKIPDEFTNVHIPNVSSTSLHAPRLTSHTSVNILFVESGASLTINKGAQLLVHEHINEFSLTKIEVKGSLVLPNENIYAVTNSTPENLRNK